MGTLTDFNDVNKFYLDEMLGDKILAAILERLLPSATDHFSKQYSKSFLKSFASVASQTDNLVDFAALLHSIEYLASDGSDVAVAADFFSRYRSDYRFDPSVDDFLQRKWLDECFKSERYQSVRLLDRFRYVNLSVNPLFLNFYRSVHGNDYDDLTAVFEFLFAPFKSAIELPSGPEYPAGYPNFYREAVVNAFLASGLTVEQILKLFTCLVKRASLDVLFSDWLLLLGNVDQLRELPLEWVVPFLLPGFE